MNAPSEKSFRVVVNDEEQYSVWPVDAPIPPGWKPTGIESSRDECLAHIGLIWTDLRPRSLRAGTSA